MQQVSIWLRKNKTYHKSKGCYCDNGFRTEFILEYTPGYFLALSFMYSGLSIFPDVKLKCFSFGLTLMAVLVYR